jgi:hypothetical protein
VNISAREGGGLEQPQVEQRHDAGAQRVAGEGQQQQRADDSGDQHPGRAEAAGVADLGEAVDQQGQPR